MNYTSFENLSINTQPFGYRCVYSTYISSRHLDYPWIHESTKCWPYSLGNSQLGLKISSGLRKQSDILTGFTKVFPSVCEQFHGYRVKSSIILEKILGVSVSNIYPHLYSPKFLYIFIQDDIPRVTLKKIYLGCRYRLSAISHD